MDVHSVEFYVIAFVVAMALFTLLMGRRERGPATTAIEEFTISPSADDAPGFLELTSVDLNRVAVRRTGIPLTPDDEAFVVATRIDDKWQLVEKRTTRMRGITANFDAAAEFTLPPGRYHVRYDSEITGQWVTFTYHHRPDATSKTQLRL